MHANEVMAKRLSVAERVVQQACSAPKAEDGDGEVERKFRWRISGLRAARDREEDAASRRVMNKVAIRRRDVRTSPFIKGF